jgi:hypothetical protein
MQRLKNKTTLEECYEQIKPAIGESIYGSVIMEEICAYYLRERKRFPSSFHMATMVTTYIAWQNSAIPDGDEYKLNMKTLARRLYPKLSFL